MDLPISPLPVLKPKLPLRMAVIEDDRIMRSMLEKLLTKHPDGGFAGGWSTGEAALPGIRADVIPGDPALPGLSGEDCLRALSGRLPASALVVLTIHKDAARVFAALRAGANGYLRAVSCLVCHGHRGHGGEASSPIPLRDDCRNPSRPASTGQTLPQILRDPDCRVGSAVPTPRRGIRAAGCLPGHGGSLVAAARPGKPRRS